jgi:hypothetical protein
VTGSLRVPGAKVAGPETAASLLTVAVWSLGKSGLIEAEQIRPVEEERAVTMGGKSFARVRPLPGEALRLGGLEGELLRKAREPESEGLLGRLDDKLAQALSGDDRQGLRGVVLSLGLDSGQPWTSVANHCRDQARAAGLVEVEGRLRRKPVIADQAAVEALRPRDAEIAQSRRRYRESDAPELDQAVFADCVSAVWWAHSTSD